MPASGDLRSLERHGRAGGLLAGRRGLQDALHLNCRPFAGAARCRNLPGIEAGCNLAKAVGSFCLQLGDCRHDLSPRAVGPVHVRLARRGADLRKPFGRDAPAAVLRTYSFVFSLASFSRMNASITGALETFLNPAFLLLGQLSKYLAQMLPQLAIQHFAAAFRNENHVVLALPAGVA
jgi:hypothetical protein